MPIIFDGEVLVAHHNPGDGPFMVVTFIGAFHEETVTTHYLMQDVAEREGIACVGLASRVRNLYICDEINEVAAKVRELRRPDQKLIMVGQSSGGFAAVKFANLFNADYVVSFSPVFSVDLEDLRLTEEMQLEREFLQIALRFHRVPKEIIRPGMRPGPEDCSVPVLFAYSIQTSSDSYAADRYEELFPSAFFLRIKHLGHAIFNYMSDGDTLLSLLGSLAQDDVPAACLTLKRATRNNEAALADMMVRVARWRPSIVPLALQTSRARKYLSEETLKNHAFNTVTAYEMAARGDVAGACAYLHRLHPSLFATDGIETGLFLVMSWHGEVLSFDTGSSQIVLAADTLLLKGHPPALLDRRGPTPRLMIRTRVGDHTVVPDEATASEHGPDFDVVPGQDGALVSFRRGDRFLSGASKSVPSFSAAEALGWELFALLPIPEEAAVSQAGVRNWFEESLVAVNLGRNEPKRAVKDAESAHRKVAFRSFLKFFGY